MPVLYAIEGDVLRMEFVEVYEPGDITQCFLSALADPACPDPVHLLVDVSRSDVITTRSEYQIRLISMFLRPHTARIGGRCALLAGSDAQADVGIRGSVYSQAIGVEARVFRTQDAALAWLRGAAADTE
jgi:hypothetical protein